MADSKETPISEQKKDARKRTWQRGPRKKTLWNKIWRLTGFRGKTGWDWLQLLIVPVVLAFITVAFTWYQQDRQNQLEAERTERVRKLENRRAEQAQKLENQRAEQAQKLEDQRAQAELELAQQNAQDAALQDYLDQMSRLLLDKDRPLRKSKEGDEVRTLARARTLTILERMDTSRQRQVIQFLSEAILVQRVEGRQPIISLRQANLSDAELWDIDLHGADLHGADLSESNLISADLSGADLNGADLHDANLHTGYLSGNARFLSEADLRGADLSESNLSGAELGGTDLREADLRGTILTSADLMFADLREADLRGANLSYITNRAIILGSGEVEGQGADVALNGADLRGADLRGAEGITREQLEKQTERLKGATMPDGSKHP